MNNEVRIPGSFRDPSGYVFLRDGVLFRQVSDSYMPCYRQLMESGLYNKLIEQQLLIPHEEVEVSDSGALLKPEPVPFVSYPYEWCFSMLKDAALATLRIQKLALKHDMILKDASAYNIQFVRGALQLIDTLSFETYIEEQPWVAYGQFCQHFLAPLSLAAYVDLRLLRMSSLHLNGIPLDLACAMLPMKAKFNPTVLVNLVTQAKLGKLKVHMNASEKPKVAKVALEAIMDGLEQAIVGMKLSGADHSKWDNYYATCTYSDQSTQEKVAAVRAYIEKINPKVVWDIGANTGRYSRIAADMKIATIAMDFDPWCVEAMYNQCSRDGVKDLLPLVQDITNPSGACGWLLEERDSIFSRGQADLVLALALVHHMAIANNVPLSSVAQFFARLGKWLIIEFVPKSDAQVQSLLALREDIFPGYHTDGFVRSFSNCFDIVERLLIPDSCRELFIMRRRF